MFLSTWSLGAVTMADETQEIASLLASTGSEIYSQIGRYLEELDFTADILDDADGDFSDLFAEDADCRRIGIPLDDGVALRDFIVSRTEQMIWDHCRGHKSRRLLLMAQRLRDALEAQNAAQYREIGRLLFEYQVHCGDLATADSLKLFLSPQDLKRMNLENKAKHKLAMAKVMKIVHRVQSEPAIEEQLDVTPPPQGPTAKSWTERESKEDPVQILREMVNVGTVSAAVFWSHFFKEVECLHFERLFSSQIRSQRPLRSLTQSLSLSLTLRRSETAKLAQHRVSERRHPDHDGADHLEPRRRPLREPAIGAVD